MQKIKRVSLSLLLGFAICFAAPSPVAAIDFIPAISGGAIFAQDNDTRAFFKAGLTVAGRIYKDLALEVAGSYSTYNISYTILDYDTARGSFNFTWPTSNETKVDGGIDLLYPIWKRYVRIDILGGYHGLWLDNDVSTFTVSGPHIGLGASKDFSFGTVTMRGGATPVVTTTVENHLPQVNISKSDPSKSIYLFGDPTIIYDYSFTYWLPKMRWTRLGIGYDGETIVFQSTTRYYNAVSLLMKF